MEVALFLPRCPVSHVCATRGRAEGLPRHSLEAGGLFPSCLKQVLRKCKQSVGSERGEQGSISFLATASPPATRGSVLTSHRPDLAVGERSLSISEYSGPSEDMQEQAGLGQRAPFPFQGEHTSFP